MAQAKQDTRTIVEKVITLTLTKDEADALRAIGRHVGGSSENSPRKHIAAITAALDAAGVTGHNASALVDRFGGSIRFVDYPPTFAATPKAWGRI